MNLRQFVSGAALLIAAALPALSHAQDYPARSMLFVVPFTPGTAADSLARLMRVTAAALILEAAFLVFFVLAVKGSGSAGLNRALGDLFTGPYGITFWLGAVVVGILVGGFLVKYVIVAAGQVSS